LDIRSCRVSRGYTDERTKPKLALPRDRRGQLDIRRRHLRASCLRVDRAEDEERSDDKQDESDEERHGFLADPKWIGSIRPGHGTDTPRGIG
jgi:hypothetical protein